MPGIVDVKTPREHLGAVAHLLRAILMQLKSYPNGLGSSSDALPVYQVGGIATGSQPISGTVTVSNHATSPLNITDVNYIAERNGDSIRFQAFRTFVSSLTDA
ncbi:MAG: hypothetical protein P1V51_20040 [Deltaproteobacteria bacterium]|nr:hypothetical protein [Deltaproteobacteria bacterium]